MEVYWTANTPLRVYHILHVLSECDFSSLLTQGSSNPIEVPLCEREAHFIITKTSVDTVASLCSCQNSGSEPLSCDMSSSTSQGTSLFRSRLARPIGDVSDHVKARPAHAAFRLDFARVEHFPVSSNLIAPRRQNCLRQRTKGSGTLASALKWPWVFIKKSTAAASSSFGGHFLTACTLVDDAQNATPSLAPAFTHYDGQVRLRGRWSAHFRRCSSYHAEGVRGGNVARVP